MTNESFLMFGGAELPWMYPLGVALAAYGPTTVVRIGVRRSWSAPEVRWPFDDVAKEFERESWSYPPGFNGALRPAFGPLLRRRRRALEGRLTNRSGVAPYVIVPEPSFAPHVLDVPADRLIYGCYDDYASYTADGVRCEAPYEQQLVERAAATFCSSIFRADALRERFPDRASRIHHLAHGVHPQFLAPASESGGKTEMVCVSGALTARYDWRVIEHVVTQLPNVTFVFVGEIGTGDVGSRQEDWQVRLERVLSYKNVRHVTGQRYKETAPFFWSADLSWLPYDSTLPFVHACSPLKLTDGLSSGRPIVSADVPECHQYPDWIHIYRDANAAVSTIRALLDQRHSAAARERRMAQIAFAGRNTWADRATTLVGILRSGDR